MTDHIQALIRKATGASGATESETIQSLWSGYGKIARYQLEDARVPSVIAKIVRAPTADNHPRGWNTDISHQRKMKSYQVESAWYKRWSPHCDASCRLPHCLAVDTLADETLILLEDLDHAGYPARKTTVSVTQLHACIEWLAHFHATFLSETPDGLWERGTYWHLATRPDELDALTDLPLKNSAAAIDSRLNASPYQTFVHGDAKLANFCFSQDGQKVAAVDFQYVGGGCGMKDLAYFAGSCLSETECEKQESSLLNHYFQTLERALEVRKKDIDFPKLESDWRALYPVAWTDFHRFLKGWSPGHWKINSYSERLAKSVVAQCLSFE